MRLPPGRNQWLDVRRRARHYIRLAEIAVVGQQRFGPAKLFRQSIDLLQHRRDLLLVVGRLNHVRRDHHGDHQFHGHFLGQETPQLSPRPRKARRKPT